MSNDTNAIIKKAREAIVYLNKQDMGLSDNEEAISDVSAAVSEITETTQT